MDSDELDAHVARGLEELQREFSDRVSDEAVTEIGMLRYRALQTAATINDFIPLLVYRQTREELVTIDHRDLHRSA